MAEKAPTKKAPAKTAEKAPAKAAAAKAVAAPKAPAAKKVRAPRQPKAIVEHDRGSRKVRQGIVVSNKMDKTVVVKIERRVQHPLYGKVVLRSNKFKAHDIIGCDEGDRVEIMETRPLSRDKRWRVTQIIEKVK
jgi:small subunit ribosomal protein S17